MNILLVDTCNLACSYCFLQGSLNTRSRHDGDAGKMSLAEFRHALDYARELIVAGTKDSANLLGGEPTLHPLFREFLSLALSPAYSLPGGSPLPVNVFTNGIFSPEMAGFLGSQPCGLMININHPSFYKGTQWSRLNDNLQRISSLRGERAFSVSLNLYQPEQDVAFVFEVMSRYDLGQLRVDFAKPNAAQTNEHISFKDVSAMLPLLETIAERCTENGIDLITDCCVPVCSVDDGQLKRLKDKGIFLSFTCPGAIDVGPGLEVFFCGPLKDVRFGQLTDYPTGGDLVRKMDDVIDPLRWEVPTCTACETCKWQTLNICQGGCLAFKQRSEGDGQEVLQ
ncbi:radical SAM protein [Roseibium sp. Sym1]|uniref:radical SAM protein n=1 Tax=Roseibium sp. Sym1 TaxID=3016006 RepID=UPI0022B3D240|nr:radical SAM protein [Roseibium sp. Sym1]